MGRKANKKLMVIALKGAAPTKGADYIAAGETGIAIETEGLTIKPLAGSNVDRNLDNGKSGNSAKLRTGEHVTFSCNVEMAGSGTAGTAPTYAPLFLTSGFKETLVADTSVTYARIEDGTEQDATIYYYIAGTLHKILGVQTNLSASVAINGAGKFSFEGQGIYGGIVSGALPAADFSSFLKPVVASAVHTSISCGGQTFDMNSFEFSENNEIDHDQGSLKNEMVITDWKPSGKMVVKAEDHTDYDPFAIVLAETFAALSMSQGSTAGNIVTFTHDKVQLIDVEYSGDKTLYHDLPFELNNSGTSTSMTIAFT